MRIAISTGGGDAPGLNAVIRAVVGEVQAEAPVTVASAAPVTTTTSAPPVVKKRKVTPTT